MTLHDREDRKLAEIERHLAEQDPRLARRLAEFQPISASVLVAVALGVLMLLPTGLVVMVIGVQTAAPVSVVGGALIMAVVPAMTAWYLRRGGGH